MSVLKNLRSRRTITKVPEPVTAPKPSFSHPSLLKAVSYRVELDDGTALVATGEHADLIYKYLQECEKICATNQSVCFLAPALERVDANGKVIPTT
jgi:hypothetical protein